MYNRRLKKVKPKRKSSSAVLQKPANSLKKLPLPLLFADDSGVFLEVEENNMMELEKILEVYEELSGQKK